MKELPDQSSVFSSSIENIKLYILSFGLNLCMNGQNLYLSGNMYWCSSFM